MQFMTINCAAKEIGLPHSFLRSMLADHRLPGFYSGSRYIVNVDMLREQLEAECRANAGDVREVKE